MKRIFRLFSMGCIFLFSSCRTSHVDLRGMSETERNAYMIKLGKEITKEFGPGYYREYKSPVVLEVEEVEALRGYKKKTEREKHDNIVRFFFSMIVSGN